jgi:NADH-quinone oxidoreductase subunit M
MENYNNLLAWILFVPTVAGVILMLIPGEKKKLVRWFALGSSLIPLVLSLIAWFSFDNSITGYQFVVQAPWYEAINSTFTVGVDGLSMTMVLLTTLLTPLAILASFGIDEKPNIYMALFMFLETGMLGVFLSLDLLLFFVFWEIGLVPMYFLINQWGSKNGEKKLWGGIKVASRTYASFKFMIVTMAGSLGLLLAIQMLGVMFGTFDLQTILVEWNSLAGNEMVLGFVTVAVAKKIAFWAFAIAFAFKVPVWPFHTWLPDAHTEAPTAGSMILAGVLLKLGAYGFLRFVLPLFPAEAAAGANVLAFMATMAIIMGAFAAYGQTDFKRLVAYSSVNHMGFVLLGIAAAASQPTGEAATIALNGAVLQMFNHGLSAAGMFFLVGVMYDRLHTRNLDEMGGYFPMIPVYGGIMIFVSMASLGLPGLNGFVSEFLVVRGAWEIFPLWTALSMIGLLFTGAYILKGISNVLHGPVNKTHVDHVSEINKRELAVIAPLMVFMLWLGVWPGWLLDVINTAMMSLQSLLG